MLSNPEDKTIEISPFDAIAGQSTPFYGFGQILHGSFELENRFQIEMADAQQRLQEGFQVTMVGPHEIPRQLDKIVGNMWNSGWDSQRGNINLFTHDFGCALAKSILDLFGGVLVFRSREDLSHLSILWADAKLEAFPFHKVLKCLHNRDGETMTSFMSGLAHKISK